MNKISVEKFIKDADGRLGIAFEDIGKVITQAATEEQEAILEKLNSMYLKQGLSDGWYAALRSVIAFVQGRKI